MNIKVKELNINYIQEGEGKDILLLHGWGGSIQTMIPILNVLKKSYKVTVLDLPGFGESDKPEKSYDSYDYAEIIKLFIDKMRLKELIIIGHSHGGRIGIIISSNYPEMICKLILIDSAGIKPKRNIIYYFKVYKFKLLKYIYIWFNKITGKKTDTEKFYKKYGSADYKEADGIMRKTLVKVINDDLKKLLGNIKSPTLLIWGENDEDTPLYMAKEMEKEISDCGLVILKNAGHYSYIDQYNQFQLVLKSFLEI